LNAAPFVRQTQNGYPARNAVLVVHHNHRLGAGQDRQYPQALVVHHDAGLRRAAAHLAADVGRQHRVQPAAGSGERERLGHELDSLTADAGDDDLVPH
jgi:hypothetical protein